MKIRFSIQNGIKWALFLEIPELVLNLYSPNLAGASKHWRYSLDGFRIVKKLNPDKGIMK